MNLNSLISAAKFVNRHKGKIIIAGTAVASYVALKSHISDVAESYNQSTMKEFVSEVNRKKNHFGETSNTCDQTVLDLSPRLIAELVKLLNVDRVFESLSKDKSNPKIWDELKVCLFSRIVGEIYSFSLFICFSKVQLSIMAGYQYLDNCNKTDSTKSVVMKKEIQIFYLSLLEKFFSEGLRSLLGTIENVVFDTTKDIPLDKKMTFEDLKNILDKAKKGVNFTFQTLKFDMAKYLITKDLVDSIFLESTVPDASQKALSMKDRLIARKIVDETLDLIETNDFKQVLKALIDVGFTIMKDILFDCFDNIVRSQSSDPSAFPTNLHQAEVPFAKALPVIHRTFKTRYENNGQSALVKQLLKLDQLETMAANVYESFCNPPRK